jgi:hypothetical protein
MSTNEPPPPPPSDNYGAPIPPPPPSGGYGEPPTPPPPAGPGGAAEYSVGNAWKYGWDKTIANIGQVLIAVLVLFAVQIVFGVGGRLISDSIIVSWFFSLISWIISMIIAAGIVRFALDVTEGKQLNAATLLTPHKLGDVIVASVLIGIATFIGFILCVIPGLLVMFFTSYTLYFLMDKPELGAIDAMKASFEFTKSNAGNVILWFLLGLVTWFVGALLCGIGLLLAIPVVLIGTAYTYKTINNEPVAA